MSQNYEFSQKTQNCFVWYFNQENREEYEEWREVAILNQDDETESHHSTDVKKAHLPRTPT